MTLPMVTCPLCCRPGFSTSDSLCSALVDVTTRKLCCPICNLVVIGLDKFTIHLFSHSIGKGIEQAKEETFQICNYDNAYSSKTSSLSNVVLKIEPVNSSTQLSSGSLKLPCYLNSAEPEEPKSVSIPENSLICFKGENGQLFTVPSECMGSSFKNVTISTQNYITNTNITTSTVQTQVIEKVQKRKYSQVFDSDCSESKSKSEVNGLDNYYNIESVNSWPSTSSLSSETDKHYSSTPEKEFESCKDLLTKGDFSTLSDDIGDLDIKNDSSFGKTVGCESMSDEAEERKKNDKKECYGCDLCSIVLPNKTILAMHKQLIHKKVEVEVESKPKLLDCSICPRTFSLRSSLMIHRKVAHDGGFGNNEPGSNTKEIQCKHACNICGKFFKKEIHLTQHMKAHDEKQWQCTICSKTFTTKYFLKKHRRLHTGETPYKCHKCDKAFTFQQSYHKHLLYHNDEKPYCCAQCGRLFKELSTLHNHERIHSGEKPFTCETCGKSFRQRVSYLVHRRIHTGAMPYKCTACNKSFRYKISQRTHKCPSQPPGIVVRTSGSLVERLQAAMSKNAEEEGKTSPPVENLDEAVNSPCKLNNEGTVSSTPAHSMKDIDISTAKPPITSDSNPIKVHIEKPQIYLLLKGPNEETYYQPLIISQSLPVTTTQTNNSYNLENSLLFQRNNSSHLNESVTSSSSKKENSNNIMKRNIPNTSTTVVLQNKIVSENKNSQNHSALSNNVHSPSNCSSQFMLFDVKDRPCNTKDINNHSQHFQQDKSKNDDGNTFVETSVLPPESSSMDEILNEFNCDALRASPIPDAPCKSPNKSLTEPNCDMIAMDSNDIFSFILNPNLTSPSDRLGRLTLSPSYNVDSKPIVERAGSDVRDSISHIPESQQDNILDNISDDALKELLFGKTN